MLRFIINILIRLDKMKNILEFEKLVKESKNILIISHVNPDGDTLGTTCALRSAIFKRFKKKAEMLVLSKIPKIYEFLPEIKDVKHIEEFDKSREYDLAITVDVASLDRALDGQVLFEKAKHSINIDHHKTNDEYGELAFVEADASSSGEVCYKILKELNWDIDLNTSTGFYTAILTDTGGFRFENTSSSVLRIASELIDLGVNPKDLYKKCYESKSKQIILFQNYCVSNAKFTQDDKIAYSIIYKKDMEKFHVGDDATDGIAEALRSINTTEVSFVVKEVDTKICKISMRSKKVDIAEICSGFGGGGHKFAAGCTIKSSCAESANKLLKEISKVI